MSRGPDPDFWRGKRVLLTGHTGFKGAWAAHWFQNLGAEVAGFALAPEDGLFTLTGLASDMESVIGDLRDPEAVAARVQSAAPDVILHMAAQALVKQSIADPIGTWESNVTGTAHLLAARRQHASEATCLCVTSDKVYQNRETGQAYVEGDPLGGKDPYSASKAACEILVGSWRQTYPGGPLATARAGNVIGGGDFSANRIIPDIVRAVEAGQAVELRHPDATRPWQHVLDCVCGYLLFIEALAGGSQEPALNFGPAPEAVTTVATVTERMIAAMDGAPWVHVPESGSVEAKLLSIDASRARALLGWEDRLAGDLSINWTADWYQAWRNGEDMAAFTRAQIHAFEELG